METAQSPNLAPQVAHSVDASTDRAVVSEFIFDRLLRRFRVGRLEVVCPNGRRAEYGQGLGAPAVMQVQDASFFARVMKEGAVGFGDAFVEGLWTSDDLAGVLGVFARNQNGLGWVNRGLSVVHRWANRLYHVRRRNTLSGSRENIEAHYDLSNDFYRVFLDDTMTYSSALFEGDFSVDLETAQQQKIERMLDLADVMPGDRVLEIGSGWGALAIAAGRRGAQVKTITLSKEQHAYATERVDAAGLSEQVEVVIQDYRELSGTYDKVLSCEMIEAVGKEFLPSYFATIQNCLKPGGTAVIQAITIPDERYAAYSRSCDWIQKRVFPGGHLPSPGAIQAMLDLAGDTRLVAVDSFAQDYAETLRRWGQRFNAELDRIAELGFDAAFARMWNYYLAYCEAGFDAGLIDVRHVVLERGR